MTTDNLSIIVIDDSSKALTIAVDLLQKAGHCVEARLGSEGAYQRIREVRPEVVVCDVMMPGINGFEL